MMHKAWRSIEEVPRLFFKVIHQISRSHGLKNQRFESNLMQLGRSQLSTPSDLPCYLLLISKLSWVSSEQEHRKRALVLHKVLFPTNSKGVTMSIILLRFPQIWWQTAHWINLKLCGCIHYKTWVTYGGNSAPVCPCWVRATATLVWVHSKQTEPMATVASKSCLLSDHTTVFPDMRMCPREITCWDQNDKDGGSSIEKCENGIIFLYVLRFRTDPFVFVRCFSGDALASRPKSVIFGQLLLSKRRWNGHYRSIGLFWETWYCNLI